MPPIRPDPPPQSAAQLSEEEQQRQFAAAMQATMSMQHALDNQEDTLVAEARGVGMSWPDIAAMLPTRSMMELKRRHNMRVAAHVSSMPGVRSGFVPPCSALAEDQRACSWDCHINDDWCALLQTQANRRAEVAHLHHIRPASLSGAARAHRCSDGRWPFLMTARYSTRIASHRSP